MILPKKEIYIKSTLAYCENCKQVELARIIAKKTGVYMQRLCPVNRPDSVKIAADYRWYMDRVNHPQTISRTKNAKKSEKGCPWDCGICEWHSGRLRRAVLPITYDDYSNDSAGFENKPVDKKNFRSLIEIENTLNHVFDKNSTIEIINLTGDNSLLHPNLFEIIEICKLSGVQTILIDTDGIIAFDDLELVQKIKQSEVQIAFTLSTLNAEISHKIHGKDLTKEKLNSLEICESQQIPTNIIVHYFQGINDIDIAEITNTYLKKDYVRNIIIQNQAVNGKPARQLKNSTIDEIENIISKASDLSQADYSTLQSYHPLCSSVAYYIVYAQKMMPLSRILKKTDLTNISEKCCSRESEISLSRLLWDGMNRLSSEDHDVVLMDVLKGFIKETFSNTVALSKKKNWLLAEKMIKAVIIHHYMDEAHLDVDRLSRCGDVFVDGTKRLIPVCAYKGLHH
jgi:uncharacterized radical SAM superfamily Fe-S cluster-containing enzyme